MFVEHTAESAPEAARPALAATEKRFGYLPSAVARLAEAPLLLDGFLKLSALFEKTSLDPLARETVVMTLATRNRCHVCVAMHTAKLRRLDADPGLVTALREGQPLPDARLAALRQYTLTVLATSGEVPEAELTAFFDAGFTRRQALEVVLGIGAYTMSTLANRLTRAELDEPMLPFA
ncbi:carboxymuconolactone decarboxylase family protein [Amycolatopsis magusensis]|uniref:carboxymuconolactone decarboxylase family protein n=1 Tax=Amycolatopsis magusensis TaxID=882444 RepID=UPI0024A9A1D6|nr:carboxymuconolactone decarboxylase family protein [Amycolatopsis magusensis]MDI5977929.1 carboxymuconolactone decarboxylase family protein [Amycolatopsis magusensis]